MDNEKRKRESDSSISNLGDLESSLTKEKSIKPKKKKEKKHDDCTHNKFATLTENDSSENSEDKETDNETKHEFNQTENISSKLKQINEKLNRVAISNEETLKGMVTEIVKQVRDEMIKIFEVKLDKLESRVFDLETENDKLKKEIDTARK